MNTWQNLKAHPELWNRYFIREQVIKAIRAFFDGQKFHEVETPLLTSCLAPESYLEPLQTKIHDHAGHAQSAYLYTSPEMSLKKLLVAGIGNCYSLTKAFRNGEMPSRLHNPEFTMLEWYRVEADYTAVMDDCEKLVQFIITHLGRKELAYQGQKIDTSSPWERITAVEAFERYAHIELIEFLDEAVARRVALSKGYIVLDDTTWEELYHQIFLNEIEKHLGRGKPTIVHELPSALAALSRRNARDPRFCERFEVYIAGIELGSAYGELTDPQEAKKRFAAQMTEVQRLGKTPYEPDQDFLKALEVGLPVSSGIGLGVDRLIMLLSDVTDVADTLFFPGKELFENV